MIKSFRLRQEDVKREWFQMDASGQVLGRLAAKAARLLMGKERPTYTPGVDSGDFVIVTNAARVRVTGKKESWKLYRHHTGYLGHFIQTPLSEMRGARPERLIELAVRRMLPKNTLGRYMLKRLKVYAGAEHPHAAQQPKPVKLASRKERPVAKD
jgi:large subunit ribosomal protein L13